MIGMRKKGWGRQGGGGMWSSLFRRDEERVGFRGEGLVLLEVTGWKSGNTLRILNSEFRKEVSK